MWKIVVALSDVLLADGIFLTLNNLNNSYNNCQRLYKKKCIINAHVIIVAEEP